MSKSSTSGLSSKGHSGPNGDERVVGAPLTSEVISKLRQFLERGDFKQGARLPAERRLAVELGISRPALREGLKALNILDVLESRRGAGTYVKSLAPLESRWPSQLNSSAMDPNMLELLEVRKIIEPRAAALAAARATESQLREIGRIRAELEDDSLDWRGVAKIDYQFHAAIIEATGNGVLLELNRVLTPLLLQSREITARTYVDKQKMHAEHYAIFHAIACGQAEAAERSMLEHLLTVGLDLISKPRR